MSYLTPSPLPRNSFDGVNACEAARARQIVNGMETLVANAQRASQMIAGPDSFRSLGAAVVIDVARSQNALAAAHAVGVPAKADPKAENLAAPTWLPLNVSVDEYNSCCQRPTTVLAPIKISPPEVTFPPVMPPRVVPPVVAPAPKWGNLCWALRNGAVDASQFEGDSLGRLQYKCMQLGYTGACFPPPNVALYLDQQRRAGTLPKIRFSEADLQNIPRAPDLTSRDCPESWRLAGMGNYRPGLGMTWGDASASRCAPSAMQIKPGTNWRTVGLFALAIGAVYVAGRA